MENKCTYNFDVKIGYDNYYLVSPLIFDLFPNLILVCIKKFEHTLICHSLIGYTVSYFNITMLF